MEWSGVNYMDCSRVDGFEQSIRIVAEYIDWSGVYGLDRVDGLLQSRWIGVKYMDCS